jgi:chromosomal replication initiation ATPase DnaA
MQVETQIFNKEKETLLSLLTKAQMFADIHFPKQYVVTLTESHSLSGLDFEQVADIILDRVCFFLRVDKDRVVGKSKLTEFVEARFMYFNYMLSTFKGYSLESLGKVCNRDHATVIHARKKHSEFMETDLKYAFKYTTLIKHLDTF